jgi:hypothetical protein
VNLGTQTAPVSGWEPLRVALACLVTHGDPEYVNWVRSNHAFDDPSTMVDSLRMEITGHWLSLEAETRPSLVRRLVETGGPITHAMPLRDGVHPQDIGMFYRPERMPDRVQYVLADNYTGRFQKLAERFETARLKQPAGILDLDEHLRSQFDRALTVICSWIASGKLVAKGIPLDGNVAGRMREILPTEIAENDATLCGLGVLHQSPGKTGPGWQSVAISWVDFMKCYGTTGRDDAPPMAEKFTTAVSRVISTSGAERQTAKAETDCHKRLVKIMKESPDKKTKSRDELFKEMCDLCPGLSEQAYDRARRDALKETGAYAWSRAGAPRGKRTGRH